MIKKGKYMKKEYEEEFYKIINEILEHEEFKKRKLYPHHGEETVYEHSLKVAYLSYKMAKKLNLDVKSAAIGGLLHDFYTTPWQTAPKPKRIRDMHGFAHPKEAYKNALEYFPNLMNPKIEDIITKHMFPLTPKLPRYKESWVITTADKITSLSVFKKPKDLPKYIGIRSKKKVKK